MGKRLTFLFVVFAMLFGGVVVPAMAHAHEGASGHSLEMLDLDCVDAGESDSGKSDPAPGAPAHADHHHCSTGLIFENGSGALPLVPAESMVHFALVKSLASHAMAPLTEPPAV